MSTFCKTELGFRTLKLRDLPLNAKQRRLLILIGSDDFSTMNPSLQNRIAAPELLLQLLDLGLIQLNSQDTHQTDQLLASEYSNNAEDSEIQLAEISEITASLQPDLQHEPHSSPLAPLDLESLKDYMAQILKQYCGLMAKQLIEQIRQAAYPAQLISCQTQWITHLQESRISPVLLNQALQQVNFSIRSLRSLS